jgi:hypothetical protein
VAAFSIGARGGFSGGLGRNYAMPGRSGSGLGATVRGPDNKGGQPTDNAISPRRRKPYPNLSSVCVAANGVIKTRQTVGLGFSKPLLKSDQFKRWIVGLRRTVRDVLICLNWSR